MSVAQLRVQKDLMEIGEDLPTGVCIQLLDRPIDQTKYAASLLVVIVPMEGFYRHLKLSFRIDVPKMYPFVGPRIWSMQRLFHPNVDYETGAVCMNILRLDWSPAFSLNVLVMGMLNILLELSWEDPLNKHAASLLMEATRIDDFDEYAKVVDATCAGGEFQGLKYDALDRVSI